jgi:hypothetical protein
MLVANVEGPVAVHPLANPVREAPHGVQVVALEERQAVVEREASTGFDLGADGVEDSVPGSGGRQLDGWFGKKWHGDALRLRT